MTDGCARFAENFALHALTTYDKCEPEPRTLPPRRGAADRHTFLKKGIIRRMKTEALQQKIELFWLPLAFALLLGIGYLDYVTEPSISFALFYLGPVALAAWNGGRRQGIITGAAASLIFFLASGTLQGELVHLVTAAWNSITLAAFLLLTAVLLSSLNLQRQRQQSLSRNDTVTTALNSRYFYEVLQVEIDRAKRYNRHFTLMYIDLDDFKKVNEAFGRKEGDAALWHCVVTISGVLRKTDTIGRLGGDEFGCLLPETGFDAADVVIGRLRAALEREMQMHKWATTFSMGVVTFATPPEKSDDAISMADALMNAVKREGKNGALHKAFV